ncbi:hypothetical protein O9G_002869 [Rozella allomycis CSF55]|uniref:Uncharacterized protein n=1 Tax=Rozella allomycis (strain CSF55) TaxID=988480 RepID=A0A075AS54_ROZAC|nr:hypothetical protein O9G_002869 [Rozella allomycis CSF55]|eukprot:EPZ33068.1 hypothetical protein O9G_002869 [Rozella allomycis CSF55]
MSQNIDQENRSEARFASILNQCVWKAGPDDQKYVMGDIFALHIENEFGSLTLSDRDFKKFVLSLANSFPNFEILPFKNTAINCLKSLKESDGFISFTGCIGRIDRYTYLEWMLGGALKINNYIAIQKNGPWIKEFQDIIMNYAFKMAIPTQKAELESQGLIENPKYFDHFYYECSEKQHLIDAIVKKCLVISLLPKTQEMADHLIADSIKARLEGHIGSSRTISKFLKTHYSIFFNHELFDENDELVCASYLACDDVYRFKNCVMQKENFDLTVHWIKGLGKSYYQEEARTKLIIYIHSYAEKVGRNDELASLGINEKPVDYSSLGDTFIMLAIGLVAAAFLLEAYKTIKKARNKKDISPQASTNIQMTEITDNLPRYEKV